MNPLLTSNLKLWDNPQQDGLATQWYAPWKEERADNELKKEEDCEKKEKIWNILFIDQYKMETPEKDEEEVEKKEEEQD